MDGHTGRQNFKEMPDKSNKICRKIYKTNQKKTQLYGKRQQKDLTIATHYNSLTMPAPGCIQ